MSRRLILLTTVLLLPIDLPAGVLSPIDLNRQADVNGKIVENETLNLSTVPLKRAPAAAIRVSPLAPESGRRATLNGGRLTHPTRVYSIQPTGTVPVTNFSAKRLPRSDEVLAQPTRTTQAAPIKDRVIQAMTPGGEAELKDQLKVRP